MKTITEHSATIKASTPKKGEDVNAKMEVFYNPEMISNRNISILLLNSLPRKARKLALPLAGSGIRGIRFLKELKKGRIKEIHFNDKKAKFQELMHQQLQKNQVSETIIKNKVKLHQEDAILFLNKSKGFDYIDLDPFGSPNPFLAAAVAAISREGILAVTATDTAALTGTYKKVTRRKYWAESQKNWMMHETALRILIRKVQLQGVQFDKALTPILSYHKDHYFRVYFKATKGKKRCDLLLKQHQYLLFNKKTGEYKVSEYNQEADKKSNFTTFAGPLWTGEIIHKKLIKTMLKNSPFPKEQKFLQTLAEEASQEQTGFYDLHELAKLSKKNPKKLETVLSKLKASRTHFSPTGFKTKKSFKQIQKALEV